METLDQNLTQPSEGGRDLNDIIENGYELSVGDILSKSISTYRENFKELFVPGLLTTLIGGLGGPFTQPQMQGGFHKVMKNHKEGGDTSSNTLFKGFDEFGDQLVGTLLLLAIIMVPIILFMIIFFALAGGGMFLAQEMDNEGAMIGTQLMIMLLQFVFFIGIVFLVGIFSFVVPLIAIGKMKGGQAVKVSWVIGKKQWLKLGLCQLLLGLVASLGVILCFVGIYLTLPVQYIGHYYMYEQVFGTKDRSNEFA